MRFGWLPSLALIASVAGLLGAGSALLSKSSASADSRESRAAALYADLEEYSQVLLEQLERGYEQLAWNVLRISRVEVRGNYRVPQARILRALNIIGEPSIFSSSIEQRTSSLLRLPWIASVRIETSIFPNVLFVYIEEEEPWLVAEYEGHSWLVSRRGTLVQTLDSLKDGELVMEISKLPRLDGLRAQNDLESFLRSPNARFEYGVEALKLIEMAGGFPFPVERFTLTPEGALHVTAVDVGQYPEVLLLPRSLKDVSERLLQLENVLQDLTERNERTASIDLRFNNQAILR